MAGHSKWANIKKRKGAQDAIRGKLFSKLIKEIRIAVKVGGPDPDANPRLRLAMDKARSNSMPKANIERAIAKATGDDDDATYENLTYEGYGPGGVAILVECLTDNRNRTSSEIKHAFGKGNGNLGSTGSVSYLFERKGLFTLSATDLDEDTVMMAVIDGGGEDLERDGDTYLVTAPFEAYDSCKKALEALEVELESSEISQVPNDPVPLEPDDVPKLERLLELLDDLDDVQDTYTNADY